MYAPYGSSLGTGLFTCTSKPRKRNEEAQCIILGSRLMISMGLLHV